MTTRQHAGRAALTVVGLAAVYVVAYAVMPNHVPFGIVLEGLVVGSLSSLAALGLVIIHRAFRIVNFAQVSMGALGAAASVVLSTGFNWPYVPSILVGLVVALVIGWLVDLLFQWRFATAPRLIATVASIALLQVLAAAEIGIPHLVDHKLKIITTFTFPVHWSHTFNSIPFTSDDVVAIIAVPLIAIALAWFFTRTDTGLAVRGASESSERAQLLGIPVRRLHRVVWLLAAALSGIGAVLSAPILKTTIGIPSGPLDLLPALAAALLAGFESMSATVVWSLVIGVMEQAVFYSYGSDTYLEVSLFVLIVVGLLVRRARAARGGGSSAGFGDWIAVREIRRIPARLASLPEVRITRRAGIVVLVAAAVLVPTVFSSAVVSPLILATTYALLAVSLVVLTGWAGQISLGQFGFAGVGAACTGYFLVHEGTDLFVALACSAIAGAVVAAVVGIPALRLPGLLLAVVTLAFAVVVSTWLLSSQRFPDLNPSTLTPPILFGRFNLASSTPFYELCLVLLVLAILVAGNFRRSRAGRALIATRDGRLSAASFAINPWRTQLTGFILSGAMAGVAGGLYLIWAGGAGYAHISPTVSVTLFSLVVIGGMGSISGGLLGAVYVWAVTTWLPSGLAELATGAGLLLVLALLPEGLAGLMFAGRDVLLRMVARRRGLENEVFGGIDEVEVASQSVPDLTRVSDPILSAQGLRISIGANEILTDVDFSVGDGEVVALLGTNGAGKSTLLRAIAGLLPARGGTFALSGRSMDDWSPEARVRAGVVMMPGGRGVFPGLTVEENLRLAGWTLRHFHKDPLALAAVTERIAALFPVLARRRATRASDLSGGEQQMLVFAQALLCRPKVLMIDELSLGLAPTVVAELLEVVRALRTDGVTIVVVEQSVNLAAEIADRGVFLERGQVRYRGSVDELLGRPDLVRSIFLAPESGRTAHEVGESAALSISGVSKQYGGVAALTEVTLSVAAGEIVAIIGANGAGKTTLLDVCSGFTIPDKGRIVFGTEEITHWSASHRAADGLGRTFQEARLFPSMTVEEALATASDRHVAVRDPFLCAMWTWEVSRSEADVGRRVDELLEDLGLTTLRERRVSELSTGSRRIVSLACAMAFEPRVILLDEPSAGLAQRECETLESVLRRLRDRTGAGMVVIDHDVPLLASLADRMVCMHLGEVLVEGTPDAVLADPRVIAAYLGENSAAVARSGRVGATGPPAASRPGPPGGATDAPPLR